MDFFWEIKKYILKIFGLKEDELQKTFLLQLNIFLIITTLMVAKPTINSIFLYELSSDALPLGYVLTAITAIIGSYFYNFILEKKPLNHIILVTQIGSIASLLIFGIAFKLSIATGMILYIPYVWVAIFGLLTASQFWILTNLVYNIREAKRVFGFIGAGAIAGGIFGGYVTSFLTNFIQAEYLLFVAAFLLLLTMPITRYIWNNEVVKLNDFQKIIRTETKSKTPLKIIRQSKLLSLIAVVVGISVLVAKLVDYQYSDYASRLIEDPEELASFFGFWFSTLSVVSLLVQLFLTKRIVGTMGVGKSLLWLPSGILIGSLLLLIHPILSIIIFIKVVDGSLKQSVNKAATELLSIPIPIDIKNKTKTFIDVVVDSIATGLAGFILIFFINGLDISSTYVSLIIVIMICLWMYFIFELRKEYINSFKKLFDTPTSKKEKVNKTDIPIISVIDSVKRVLQNGSENQILYMLNKTLEVKDERFFYSIKKLLEHPSNKVRSLAIENLYYLNTENLSYQIEPMVYINDQEVTTAAFRYLLKHYDEDKVALFDKYLNDSDETISNASLIGLSSEIQNSEKLQTLFNLENRIEKAINASIKMPESNLKDNKILSILDTIGNAKVEKFYPIIYQNLKSEKTTIHDSAFTNAAKTLDPQFIDVIISNLSRKETRKSALNALYSYGEYIIDVLTIKVKNEDIRIEDAFYIPLVIEKFASPYAIKSLIKLTEGTEHIVKIEAIEALRRLKWSSPHLHIHDRLIVDKILDECEIFQKTLSAIHSQIIIQYKKKDSKEYNIEEDEARKGLLKLLEQRLDRQIQRIFKFLGMKYLPSEVDPILDVILTGKEEQRIHAIEFLDNILDIQLKKELIPIAESVMIDTFSEDKIKNLSLQTFSELECYKMLLIRKDASLKQSVLYLIKKTNNKKFIPLVRELINEKNENVRNQAIETLNHLSEN